jgi:hypothetical protein
MGATGEESFRTGSGAKTETNVRRVIKKERRVVVLFVIYITLLEQLEASGSFSFRERFIY